MLTRHLDYLLAATPPETYRAASALSESNGERAEAMAERAMREVAGIVFGKLSDSPEIADVAVTVAATRALFHAAVGASPKAELDAWKLGAREAVREAVTDLRAARAREILSGDDSEIIGEDTYGTHVDGTPGRVESGRMAPISGAELVAEAVAAVPTARARAILTACLDLTSGREWSGGNGTRRRATLGPVEIARPGNSALLRALGESVTGAARERIAAEADVAISELAEAVAAVLARYASETGHAGRVPCSEAVAELDAWLKLRAADTVLGSDVGPAWRASRSAARSARRTVRERGQRMESGDTYAGRKATPVTLRITPSREAILATAARGPVGELAPWGQYSAPEIAGARAGMRVGNAVAGQGAPVTGKARAELAEARAAEAARMAEITRANDAHADALMTARDARHAAELDAYHAARTGRAPSAAIAERAERAEAEAVRLGEIAEAV